MNNLGTVAYNQSFTERLSDLAVRDVMEKEATFHPAFSAAKDIIDPLAVKSLSALGEKVFRGSATPDFWTSLKNMALMGYGQAKEMHGLRDDYMSGAQRLAERIKGMPAQVKGPLGQPISNGRRAEAISRMKDLTSAYRAEKQRGFTAIGATAQPRIDFARMVAPAVGAAGVAGAGGLYLGNEENQRQLEETLKNKTLMERLKFLISPRRSIQNYFMEPAVGNMQEKQSSIKLAEVFNEPRMNELSRIPRAAERPHMPPESALPAALLLTALTAGPIGAVSRLVHPTDSDQFKDREWWNRMVRGELRGDLTSLGASTGSMIGAGIAKGTRLAGRDLGLPGAIAGALAGGYGGYRAGGVGGAVPSLWDKLRMATKQSSNANFHLGRHSTAQAWLPLLAGAGIGAGIRAVNAEDDPEDEKRPVWNRALRGAGRGIATTEGIGLGGSLGAGVGLLGGGVAGGGIGALIDKLRGEDVPGPGTSVGFGAGALLGALGGTVGGSILGGRLGYRLSGKVGEPHDKEKHKHSLEKNSSFWRGLGSLMYHTPILGKALLRTTGSGIRGAAEAFGHVGGELGQPMENIGRRFAGWRSRMGQNARNEWRIGMHQPTKPFQDPALNPKFQPRTGAPTTTNRRLGYGMMLGTLGAAGGGAEAAMNPEFRKDLANNNIFTPAGAREALNIAKSPFQADNNEMNWAASQFGLPMMKGDSVNGNWHKPQILGY